MLFKDLWEELRREAIGVKIDIMYKTGSLEMQWSFSDQKTMLKIIKLLKQNNAKYRVENSTVYFWVEVNKEGKLALAED